MTARLSSGAATFEKILLAGAAREVLPACAAAREKILLLEAAMEASAAGFHSERRLHRLRPSDAEGTREAVLPTGAVEKAPTSFAAGSVQAACHCCRTCCRKVVRICDAHHWCPLATS